MFSRRDFRLAVLDGVSRTQLQHPATAVAAFSLSVVHAAVFSFPPQSFPSFFLNLYAML